MNFITIERFQFKHYKEVVNLFSLAEWNTPEYDEICNVGFVALDKKKVVGFIWCLVGKCSTAYIDYLIVDKKYRLDKKENRSIVGLMLANAVFNFLSDIHIKRWICFTSGDEPGKSLSKFYDSLNFKSDIVRKKYWGDINIFKKAISKLLR